MPLNRSAAKKLELSTPSAIQNDAPKKYQYESESEVCKKFSLDLSQNRFFKSHKTYQIVHDVKYVGLEEFTSKIERCIALLREKAPHYYALFCKYNIKIRSAEKSCASFQKGSIDIGESWFDTPDEELAGMLIHEIVHFWQNKNLPSASYWKFEGGKWQGIGHQKRELEALKYQVDVLKLLDADEYSIDHTEKQRGTHWQRWRNYNKPW